MGNPIEENRCIRCGIELIDLTSLWSMCSGCTKKTREELVKIRQRKKIDKDSPRKFKMWIPKIARKV